MAKEIFLGVVERPGSVYIPWRGTNCSLPKGWKENVEYGGSGSDRDKLDDPGQLLLVTLDINKAGNGKLVKVELPALWQIAQMKRETEADFKALLLVDRVRLLAQLNLIGFWGS